MSQLFISNATAFEAYSKETTYTVYVITKWYVEPAVFSSKSKATDFAILLMKIINIYLQNKVH